MINFKQHKKRYIIISIILVFLILVCSTLIYATTPRFTPKSGGAGFMGDSGKRLIEHYYFDVGSNFIPNMDFSVAATEAELKNNEDLGLASMSYNSSSVLFSLANDKTSRIGTILTYLYTGDSQVKTKLVCKKGYWYTFHYQGYGIRNDNGNRETIDFIVSHNLEPVKHGSPAEGKLVPNSADDKFVDQYHIYKYETYKLANETYKKYQSRSR